LLLLLSDFQLPKDLSFVSPSQPIVLKVFTLLKTTFCIRPPWRNSDLGPNYLKIINYKLQPCLHTRTAAAAARAAAAAEAAEATAAAHGRDTLRPAADATWQSQIIYDRFRVTTTMTTTMRGCSCLI